MVRRAGQLPSISLSPRAACDLEMLATGGFSPLDRFMGKADYRRVLADMRLNNGLLFPIPITLAVPRLDGIALDREVSLRNASNLMLATMHVEEIFERDCRAEAHQVCASVNDPLHPLFVEMASWGRFCLSGPLRIVDLPLHHDFPEFRRTPSETRRLLNTIGNPNVIGFSTQNSISPAQQERIRPAVSQARATLLLHSAAGANSSADLRDFRRVRTYQAVLEETSHEHASLLTLSPLSLRLAGPREALWHAIVLRNYGVSHFLIGRNYASPRSHPGATPFYAPDAARDLLTKYSHEIGIHVLADPDLDELQEDRIEEDASQPRGFCLWLTGLPCSGKSTIAEIVRTMLMARGRYVTLLDGDVVRTHLSKGLGFSREDRDANILRIGFVASEIVRHGGIVICAAVSPYSDTRNQVRNRMPAGRFIEIFVNTPIAVCEQRDVKGMYARARAGELRGFTGVDDPYEPPLCPEIDLNTTETTPSENADRLLAHLVQRGLL